MLPAHVLVVEGFFWGLGAVVGFLVPVIVVVVGLGLWGWVVSEFLEWEWLVVDISRGKKTKETRDVATWRAGSEVKDETA